ncbi:MAG: PEGA domain-containing protein [Myxococcota bacterium]
MVRWKPLGVLAALWWGLSSGVARAAEEPDPEAGARRAFALGVEHLERADYDKALRSFREAYAVLPRPIILYNIAVTFSRRGDAPDAVAHYEKALAGGLKPKWEAKARSKLAAERAELVEVSIRCNVEGARITVNDRDVGAAPLQTLVRHGRLIVLADAPGYLTRAETVEADRGGKVSLPLDLQKAARPVANLKVDSRVRGAEVYIDGVLMGVTPMRRTIGVSAGEPHRITLRRPGYRDRTETMAPLYAGGTETVTLDPELDRDAVDRAGARLKLTLAQPATVRIDGVRVDVPPEGLALPPGPHALRAELTGYDALVRTIDLAPQRTTTERIDLVMLEETRADKISAATNRQILGWSLAGGGLALGGAGLGVYLWNRDNVTRWTNELEVYENREGPWAPCGRSLRAESESACTAAGEALGDNAELARAYDGVAIGAMAVGGATAVAGSLVLLLSDDPSDYELKLGDELATVRLSPFGLAGTF